MPWSDEKPAGFGGGGGGNLGSASFSITADSSSFNKEIEESEARVRAFTQEVTTLQSELQKKMEALGSEIVSGADKSEISTRRLMGGFRALTSVSKDLGEGVHDIGEGMIAASGHLERAAWAFGVDGPLFVGMLGLSAAAASFGRNWEDLKDIIGDTTAFDFAGHKIRAFADLFLLPGGSSDQFRKMEGVQAKEIQSIEDDIAEKRAKAAEQEKEAMRSRKEGEKALTQEQRQQGSLFREAEARFGADRVRAEALRRAVAGRQLDEDMKKKVEEQVDIAIAEARRGAIAPAQFERMFGAGVAGEFAGVKFEHDEPKRRKAMMEIRREMAAADKAGRDKEREDKRRFDDQVRADKEQFEDQKRERIEALQDEADAIHKRQMALRDQRATPEVFSAGAELARSLMTSGLSMKPEMEEFKKMNKQLEKIHDAIKVQQRARFN